MPQTKSRLEELTPSQVQQLKEILIQTRDELHFKARNRKAEGMYEISRDDLSDEADLASVETAQEVDFKLAEHDQMKINLIERALKKIESVDGEYGLCEATGDPIGFKRLSVTPWALYSLRHQEDLEKDRRG
jgi:DnaK suppressor protein